MEEQLEIVKRILEKAYRIEAGLENEAHFKAFISTANEEEKKVLFTLMSDSERHKLMLEGIAKKLGFEFENRPETFEFSDKKIFNELYNIEKSAKALYDELISNFGELLGENLGAIKKIAEDEAKHIKLVERFVDRTMRII